MNGFACTHGREAEGCTVRFKGDLSHICHLSSTKKTHREKKMKKVKKAHITKEKCHQDLIKSRKGMNNVESVYSRASKGQRLYTVIVKMTT